MNMSDEDRQIRRLTIYGAMFILGLLFLLIAKILELIQVIMK
jgi:hypothetical protein